MPPGDTKRANVLLAEKRWAIEVTRGQQTIVAAAPEIRVDWSPIDTANFCQCRLRARLGRRTRGDDNAPRRLPESNFCVARRSRCGHAHILRTNRESLQASGRCTEPPASYRRARANGGNQTGAPH